MGEKFTQKFSNNRENYNQRINDLTMKYQKKFGFELNPDPKHRTWNVEADAFKHALLGADLSLKYSPVISMLAGIYHENETKNNPRGEWNMDSWNNAEGRKIAKEINKEYGRNFKKLPQKEQDAIVASKVYFKMRNGDLITHPSDTRKFNGFLENLFDFTSTPTGQAANIQEPLDVKPLNFETPNNNRIYSREDINAMNSDEYAKAEPEIMEQWGKIGIPTNAELHNSSDTVYVAPYTRQDGTKVKGYYRSK